MLSTDTTKYWDVYNSKYEKTGLCIAFQKDGHFYEYTYQDDGLKRWKQTDVRYPNTYKLINDSVLYEGFRHLLIKKLTNDTLIVLNIRFPKKKNRLHLRKTDKIIFSKKQKTNIK